MLAANLAHRPALKQDPCSRAGRILHAHKSAHAETNKRVPCHYKPSGPQSPHHKDHLSNISRDFTSFTASYTVRLRHRWQDARNRCSHQGRYRCLQGFRDTSWPAHSFDRACYSDISTPALLRLDVDWHSTIDWIVAFADAGKAKANLDREDGRSLLWRSYKSASGRAMGRPGKFQDQAFFAKYDYKWDGKPYYVENFQIVRNYLHTVQARRRTIWSMASPRRLMHSSQLLCSIATTCTRKC